MSQAETKNTSKSITRRSATALVSLAATAASAAAAIAPARTGLPIGEYSYPDLAARFDVLYERWHAQSWDEIQDVLLPLVREIVRQPARSLLDLTLKARTVAVIEYDIWIEGEGEVRDIGAVAVHSLVDDLCRLAGIDLLPGVDLVPFVTIDECG